MWESQDRILKSEGNFITRCRLRLNIILRVMLGCSLNLDRSSGDQNNLWKVAIWVLLLRLSHYDLILMKSTSSGVPTGISWSTTVCIAYLMTKHRMRYQDALSYIRGYCQRINPNAGFSRQLRLLDEVLSDEELREKSTVAAGEVEKGQEDWKERSEQKRPEEEPGVEVNGMGGAVNEEQEGPEDVSKRGGPENGYGDVVEDNGRGSQLVGEREAGCQLSGGAEMIPAGLRAETEGTNRIGTERCCSKAGHQRKQPSELERNGARVLASARCGEEPGLNAGDNFLDADERNAQWIEGRAKERQPGLTVGRDGGDESLFTGRAVQRFGARKVDLEDLAALEDCFANENEDPLTREGMGAPRKTEERHPKKEGYRAPHYQQEGPSVLVQHAITSEEGAPALQRRLRDLGQIAPLLSQEWQDAVRTRVDRVRVGAYHDVQIVRGQEEEVEKRIDRNGTGHFWREMCVEDALPFVQGDVRGATVPALSGSKQVVRQSELEEAARSELLGAFVWELAAMDWLAGWYTRAFGEAVRRS